MLRFSLGRVEDDGEEGSGPRSPRPSPKRQKTTTATPTQQPPPAPPPQDDPPEIEELIEEGEEEETEEVDEEASEHEVEEEEDDSDFEEEDDGEDKVVEELENLQVGIGEGTGTHGSISVILTDADVLDCPICLENLSIPVFQCCNYSGGCRNMILFGGGPIGDNDRVALGDRNAASDRVTVCMGGKCEKGHVACSSCCLKIDNRCPSCSWPIGYNRCRAIEKVLESFKVSCRNVKSGCKEMMRYGNKREHENLCAFAPCSCPLLDCNFIGSCWNMYAHFGCKHLTSAERLLFNRPFEVSFEKNQRFLILQEIGEGVIFILNHFSGRGGSAVNVVCIGPVTPRREFSYHVIARDGETSIKLQASVESTPKWVDCLPAKNFLMVPSYYYTAPCAQLKLEVCIRKHRE